MNIVILSGNIISEIDFNFIYNKNKKEKHTSIVMCKLKLDNDSIIDVYGYDEVADYLYRNSDKYVCIEGRIDTNMMVEILKVEKIKYNDFIYLQNA